MATVVHTYHNGTWATPLGRFSLTLEHGRHLGRWSLTLEHGRHLSVAGVSHWNMDDTSQSLESHTGTWATPLGRWSLTLELGRHLSVAGVSHWNLGDTSRSLESHTGTWATPLGRWSLTLEFGRHLRIKCSLTICTGPDPDPLCYSPCHYQCPQSPDHWLSALCLRTHHNTIQLAPSALHQSDQGAISSGTE